VQLEPGQNLAHSVTACCSHLPFRAGGALLAPLGASPGRSVELARAYRGACEFRRLECADLSRRPQKESWFCSRFTPNH
jgi:hypothetical protein